jgi:hypothetical protein
LAGLLDTQELPNLKEIFRDEDIGVAAVHILGDKLVLHSELFGRRDRQKLEQAQLISVMIDEAFKDKGVDKLYTWAETEEQYRYNIFLGYKPTGEEVVMPEDYPRKVFEFVKEL